MGGEGKEIKFPPRAQKLLALFSPRLFHTMSSASTSLSGRIVLDASLTPANARPIRYETRGGVPQGKLEFNSFKGKSPLNGFVLAVHEAYSNHYTLRLTPDDLWTVVTQGVGHHVQMNAERLRSKFVAHAGKQLIKVRRDGFVRGQTTCEDWMGVVAELTQGVRALDNGGSQVMKQMVQHFASTTQPIHTFCYQVGGTLASRSFPPFTPLLSLRFRWLSMMPPMITVSCGGSGEKESERAAWWSE
jgi:hypothetical protein